MRSVGPSGDATIMWWRRDLRLADNPALLEAIEAGRGSVAGLFVLDPALFEPAGRHRRDYLLSSLTALSESMGSRLIFRVGDPVNVVPEVAAEVGAATVMVSADYGPYGRRRDGRVAAALAREDVAFRRLGSPYAVSPGRLLTNTGIPFQVFTPFYRAWQHHGWRPPAPRPSTCDEAKTGSDDADQVVEWVQAGSDRMPDHDAVAGAGEDAAHQAWAAFLGRVAGYEANRDRPDLDATSRMSVHLKYGEIHTRTLLADLAGEHMAQSAHWRTGADAYRRELAWREFCADLLARYPNASWHPLRSEFGRMNYDPPEEAFEAWRTGQTGYPFVDAGMRQLIGEGFMHNRVRMVTASFLVKDLHVHWKHGARWFMRQLRDGDLASNSLNWQWVAGCGVDAAPYFRIFNPVTQGLKFDPAGDYVRRWVPELRGLAGKAAHEPWKHRDDPNYPASYPAPIVDHAEARQEALHRLSLTR